MNEYIFYTAEGITLAPSPNENINNCQILGFVEAKNISEAKELLFQENPWIHTGNFSMSEIKVKQILTKEQKEDIQTIVGHYWSEEERHTNYIYNVLKRLKQIL